MAITEHFASSEAVGATEWSCTTDTAGPDADTTDGVFLLFLDLSDMIAGDQLQVRLYEKVQAAGTQRVVFEAILTGAQSQPVWVSPSFILMHGWDFTVKTLAGTSITVEFSVRKVA